MEYMEGQMQREIERGMMEDDPKATIYIQFSDTSTIRKWSGEPFEGAVEYVRGAGAGVARPDDDDLLPHLPEWIHGERRCGIQRSVWLDGWFIPWSPRNDNENAEGPWSHWVALAQEILEADAKARAALENRT